MARQIIIPGYGQLMEETNRQWVLPQYGQVMDTTVAATDTIGSKQHGQMRMMGGRHGFNVHGG